LANGRRRIAAINGTHDLILVVWVGNVAWDFSAAVSSFVCISVC
jgi:hypothetical protein